MGKGTKFLTSYNNLGQQTVKYKPWHGSKLYEQGQLTEFNANKETRTHDELDLARAEINQNMERVRPNTVLREMDNDFFSLENLFFDDTQTFDNHNIHH
jgi:hypothetical protein